MYNSDVRDHNMDDIRHLADSFEESKENKEIQDDLNKDEIEGASGSGDEEEDSKTGSNEEEEEENSENDEDDDEDVIVDSSDDRPIIDTEGV